MSADLMSFTSNQLYLQQGKLLSFVGAMGKGMICGADRISCRLPLRGGWALKNLNRIIPSIFFKKAFYALCLFISPTAMVR